MEDEDGAGFNREKATMYYQVFGEGVGRKVLDDLASDAGFFADTFHPDPYINAYRSGYRRWVGRILNLVSQGDAVERAQQYHSRKDEE